MNNDAISKLLDRDITYDGPTAVLRFESHDQAINFICEARRLVGLQPSYVPLKHTNAAPQGPENREARDGSSTALPTVSTPEVAAPTPRTDAGANRHEVCPDPDSRCMFGDDLNCPKLGGI